MTNHLDYYASRAVQSEQFAERAISPSLADSYANEISHGRLDGAHDVGTG